MKNEEILKKAIEKAINNGWTPPLLHANLSYSVFISGEGYIEKTSLDKLRLEEIIFNHDFAKAFFKGFPTHLGYKMGRDYPICNTCSMNKFHKEQPWQYHLQQMVLEEDPLKFLEKFL